MVCLDVPTHEKENFNSTKILLDITWLPVINNWMCFTLDGVVYDVHIKEISWSEVSFWQNKKGNGMKSLSSAISLSSNNKGSTEISFSAKE